MYTIRKEFEKRRNKNFKCFEVSLHHGQLASLSFHTTKAS
jgi:hypothetical protein